MRWIRGPSLSRLHLGAVQRLQYIPVMIASDMNESDKCLSTFLLLRRSAVLGASHYQPARSRFHSCQRWPRDSDGPTLLLLQSSVHTFLHTEPEQDRQ